MHKSLGLMAGVLLCCALALLGAWLAAAAGLAVPGPVIGLGLYLAWLWSGRGIAWSRPGADLLLRWLGAMVVPAVIAVVDMARAPGFPALKVLAILLISTPVTALVTAGTWRLLSGPPRP